MDPGWYPDPNSPGKERYWNGVGWIRSDNPQAPPDKGARKGASRRVVSSKRRLPESPVPLPVLGVVLVALVVVGLIWWLSGDDGEAPEVARGRNAGSLQTDSLASVQEVFADNGLTCTAEGAFLQRPVFVADRLPSLGDLMGWSGAQEAAARRLAADLNVLSSLEPFPMQQINCGDDSTFRALGGLIAASPTTTGDRLPVIVYVSPDNQLQPQLADAGALVVHIDKDMSGPQTSGCPIEKRTVETALGAASSSLGAYPATLSELVGPAPDHFLTSDPSARWTYDVAQPQTLVGKQACEGY